MSGGRLEVLGSDDTNRTLSGGLRGRGGFDMCGRSTRGDGGLGRDGWDPEWVLPAPPLPR